MDEVCKAELDLPYLVAHDTCGGARVIVGGIDSHVYVPPERIRLLDATWLAWKIREHLKHRISEGPTKKSRWERLLEENEP